MSEERLDPELTTLAEQLGQLRPAPAELPRDRLMYLAGQAAGTRKPNWRSALVGIALLIAGLVSGVGVERLSPRAPIVVERIVKVGPEEFGPSLTPTVDSGPSAAPVAVAPSWRHGLIDSALSAPPLPAGAGPPPAWPLEELLGLPLGAIEPAVWRRWEKVLHPGDRS